MNTEVAKDEQRLHERVEAIKDVVQVGEKG